MSTKRKRLQLRLEIVRNLDGEELDHIQGGVVVPDTAFTCLPCEAKPWPGENPPPDNDPTPPIGIPQQMTARNLPPKRPLWPVARSANGYCTGI
jgi:hypothetical protein